MWLAVTSSARHGNAVTSSTLLPDPPIQRNHRCILHQKVCNQYHFNKRTNTVCQKFLLPWSTPQLVIYRYRGYILSVPKVARKSPTIACLLAFGAYKRTCTLPVLNALLSPASPKTQSVANRKTNTGYSLKYTQVLMCSVCYFSPILNKS